MKKIFLFEAAYAGLFGLQNIENEMVEQILLIYCPNLLFPFIRSRWFTGVCWIRNPSIVKSAGRKRCGRTIARRRPGTCP